MLTTQLIIIVTINVIGAVIGYSYIMHVRSKSMAAKNELKEAIKNNRHLVNQLNHLEYTVATNSFDSKAASQEINLLKQQVRIGAMRIKRLRNKVRKFE